MLYFMIHLLELVCNKVRLYCRNKQNTKKEKACFILSKQPKRIATIIWALNCKNYVSCIHIIFAEQILTTVKGILKVVIRRSPNARLAMNKFVIV